VKNPIIESILHSFRIGNDHCAVLDMLKARVDPVDLFVYIINKIDEALPGDDIEIYKYLDDSLFAARVTESFWMRHKWRNWKEVDADLKRDRDRRLGIVDKFLDKEKEIV